MISNPERFYQKGEKVEKHILIRMPDKSVWIVSHRAMAEIIARKKQASTLWEENETLEGVIEELLAEDDAMIIGCDQLMDWLDWSDIAPHALQVKKPDPPYEEWWKKQIDHWRDFQIAEEQWIQEQGLLDHKKEEE